MSYFGLEFQIQSEEQQIEPQKQQHVVLEQIIKQRYKPQQKSLILNECHSQMAWRKILLKGDWNDVKNLSLSDCNINATDIQVLSEMELQNIQTLTLQHNKIQAKGLDLIISKYADILRQLDVSYCQIKQLPQSILGSQLSLRKLYLYQNPIGSRGIKLFIRANLPYLWHLNISSCQIGNQGMIHFTKSKLSSLQRLWVHFNRISLEAYEHLSQANWKLLAYFCQNSTSAICYQSIVIIESAKYIDFSTNHINNQKIRVNVFRAINKRNQNKIQTNYNQ